MKLINKQKRILIKKYKDIFNKDLSNCIFELKNKNKNNKYIYINV